MNRYNINIRNSQILEAYQKATPVAKIAKRHNISVRQVYYVIKKFADLYATDEQSKRDYRAKEGSK